MNLKKASYWGILSILLIFSLITSCAVQPKPSLETKPNDLLVAKLPTKVLGTPGTIGTILGIPSILEKLHLIFVPGHFFDFGSSDGDDQRGRTHLYRSLQGWHNL